MSSASSAATTSGQLATRPELFDQAVGAGRGEDVIEECRDGRPRLGTDELLDDLAVAKRLDRGNAADAELTGEPGVGVDVDLHELDRTRARLDLALQHGGERMARPAPLGPEVHDHGALVRAVEDGVVEGELGDVHWEPA